MEDSTVLIDLSADRTTDVGGHIQNAIHGKNGGETAEQILLISRTARCGFWGVGKEGCYWKQTLHPGRRRYAAEGGSNTTGEHAEDSYRNSRTSTSWR